MRNASGPTAGGRAPVTGLLRDASAGHAPTNAVRDASDRPAREVSWCECCGTNTVIAVEGLFRNPRPGSPRRLCSPACRQAASRRRQAGVAASTRPQRSGGRGRRLRPAQESSCATPTSADRSARLSTPPLRRRPPSPLALTQSFCRRGGHARGPPSRQPVQPPVPVTERVRSGRGRRHRHPLGGAKANHRGGATSS